MQNWKLIFVTVLSKPATRTKIFAVLVIGKNLFSAMTLLALTAYGHYTPDR